MKKIIPFFALIISIMLYGNSVAETLEYDSIKVGILYNYTTSNGKYSFEFEEGENAPESYTYTGKVDNTIDTQIKKIMQKNKNIQNITVAIKLDMDTPVFVQAVTETQLYIQPDPVKRNGYTVIGVCIPETDDCGKMKIFSDIKIIICIKK